MSNLVLVAPMQGWVTAIEEVPDPVFSERLLGDGVAVDPTSASVRAPCDGTVVSLAKHAVTLRAANGAEILIHVGLETVALHGQGFLTEVAEGRSVKKGDPLLRLDLDFLFERAKSLISPVVITNSDKFRIVRRTLNREIGSGDFLMEIASLGNADIIVPGESGEASRDVAIMLAHGIHARPAAVLARSAMQFDSEIALIRGGRQGNAKSVVALMSLGVKHGERIALRASGRDAESAVATLAELIAGGLGEIPVQAPQAVDRTRDRPRAPEAIAGSLRGVCAAPGLAIGQAVQFRPAEIPVAEEGEGIAQESAALKRALDAVRRQLELGASSGDMQTREILSAHVALLDDPEIAGAARIVIERGKSAAFGWRASVREFVGTLRAMDDALMRERAQDLLDIEAQVIAAITGLKASPPCVPRNAILLASEFLPSQLISLKNAGIAGFCSAGGGPTSHVAIIAAGMNIPALVSAGTAVEGIADGTDLVLDADGGVLHVAPSPAVLAEARSVLESGRVQRQTALTHALEEGRTRDGTRIEVFANLGSGVEEARAAVALGAEGCGLLRTEFLFQDRETAPSEDEQTAAYQAIASALEGRPLIVRCFDIGGDKPVSYLQLPPEENPALGLRGIRTGLWQPGLLRTQLAAILRVTPLGQARIMLPMVVSLSELRRVRALIDGIALERSVPGRVALGVMVETPASAVLADQISLEADFISIGTNDLTQYALAMDRGNAQLAPQVDAFHPAVLRLIAEAARGARANNKPVGVCGGLAADPLAVPLLLGLGVDELSVPSSAIPTIKATIRALDLARCREAAEEALRQATPEAVRAVAKECQP
jgi:phosphocarrier protein FPr/phosphocarrier protein